MHSYLVKWELDIPADSPREAVEQAMAMLLSDSVKRKLFKVVVNTGHRVTIDLGNGSAG